MRVIKGAMNRSFLPFLVFVFLVTTVAGAFAEQALLQLQRSTNLNRSWETISISNSLISADGQIDLSSFPNDANTFYRLVISPIAASGGFDFEPETSLDSFSVFPVPAPFSWQSGISPFGTNGGGLLSSGTTGTAIFKTGQRAPFNTSSNYRTSIDFYFNSSQVNTIGETTIEFGYVGTAQSTNFPKPALAARLIRWSQNNQKGFNYRNDNTNSSGSGSMPGYYGVTLPNGWYRILLAAQFVGGDLSQVTFRTSLYSLGSDGLTAPTELLNHTNSLSNPGLIQSPVIYPYLKTSAYSGATVFDNISYSVAPGGL